ncbi:hypothetical protein MMC32_003178 [Xylographa parallela]|nr:hypothetical protein [Xylographa parallela]
MASKTLKRKRDKGDVGRDRVILVAVDFGTTFSGIAWVYSSQPNIRNTIIQWPNSISDGLEGITKPKVPTELQYAAGSINWGYKIPDSANRHKWFKFSLDPTQERNLFSLERELPDSHALATDSNVTAEKLVIDYLTALRQHVEQVLQYKTPKDTLARTPLQYCLTVPAVWSETAQAKTRACAVAAGMAKDNEVTMITEPEAAATYALDAMNPHDLKVGSTFVLVDAGGGTVDLISYKVVRSIPIAKAHHDPMWEDEVLQEAMTTFETFTKGSYQGCPREVYTIPVSGLADSTTLGIRRGKLTVTGADVKGVFQPVIDEIITLVKGQIRATRPTIPQAVLLVGGFGQSSYLRECIRRVVSDSGIDVMQSPNGWTAVVEGALMRVLSQHALLSICVDIIERRARKHYGVECSVLFDAEKHDILKRYWCAYKGAFVINEMQWFVNKGDVVEEREPNQLHFRRQRLVVSGHPENVIVAVFFCADRDDIGAPRYLGPSVKELVRVTADLHVVPLSAFPVSNGKDGQAYYCVCYQIAITYYSASTKYELIHHGKNYGPVTAEQV